MAGKGDRYRAVDKARFDKGWDRAFRKQRMTPYDFSSMQEELEDRNMSDIPDEHTNSRALPDNVRRRHHVMVRMDDRWFETLTDLQDGLEGETGKKISKGTILYDAFKWYVESD